MMERSLIPFALFRNRLQALAVSFQGTIFQAQLIIFAAHFKFIRSIRRAQQVILAAQRKFMSRTARAHRR
jgi:hypothetical protein